MWPGRATALVCARLWTIVRSQPCVRFCQLRIETLADNLGSKMNALVQRGAPRDLLDIREAVAAGLVTSQDCWELWERKNPGLAIHAGKMEVARRLEELELRRPLRSLADAAERERAAQARAWYRNTFLQS
jgi:predicted nucleotidyltransferase component of viral defense system